MPFYVVGGVGPLRWYHRLGGSRRRRPLKPLPPARPESPAVARARFTAGITILAACAVLIVALVVALAVSG